MTKVTEAARMRRDHRGSRSDSCERAPRRERAGEHRAGLVADAHDGADAGHGPDARSGADSGRGPEGGRETEGASEAHASRASGGQEGTRIGDTLTMMLDRLRDAAAAHDQDCAQDRD